MSADDFISFEEVVPTPGRKTSVVSICNRRSGDELGQIRWFGAWRQYCFYPSGGTIFNPTCLARITDEILAMMEARP
jgi:hypothetical protein